MAVFADPESAAFCVWQAKEHKGARIVKRARLPNFNGLNTRDVEGAKSFCGSVFGWTTLALDAGEMWTLPGYGDHLEDPQGATLIASQFVPENKDVAGETEADVGAA